MVAEPTIRYKTSTLNEFAGQEVFVIQESRLRLTIPRIVSPTYTSYHDKWSITSGKYRSFAVNSRLLEAGEFIDQLREKYPNHFEWLLFHPEWL